VGTREDILDTSLWLFNNRGAHATTTRHIASAMNISPGNLYYHFRNKEEIVRCLLERMIGDYNAVYRWRPESEEEPLKLNEVISRTGDILYEYRFFYAEIAVLFDKDPLLRKRYSAIKRERMDDFGHVLSMFLGMDILKEPVTKEDFGVITENLWGMAESMIQSMRINGQKITRESVQRSFERIMHTIKPYIKREAWPGK